jgi:hypothetical protein
MIPRVHRGRSFGQDRTSSAILPSDFIICTRTFWKSETLAHTSKKQGKGQADGGGQVSHAESLTENV